MGVALFIFTGMRMLKYLVKEYHNRCKNTSTLCLLHDTSF